MLFIDRDLWLPLVATFLVGISLLLLKIDLFPIEKQLPNGKCGTAFYVDTNTLVTANHVVSGSKTLWIYVGGRGMVNVIYTDNGNDIAVLSTSQTNPNYLRLGTLIDGERVTVYGYPQAEHFGTNLKRKTGRAWHGYVGFRQVISFKVDIWPGNSGSPVVNSRGEVVGTVTVGYPVRDMPYEGAHEGYGSADAVIQQIFKHNPSKPNMPNIKKSVIYICT